MIRKLSQAVVPSTTEASEQRWDSAFSAALDPMLIVDDERRHIDVNSAATKLLGYSYDELIGHRIDEVIAPRNRDRIAPAWARFVLDREGRGEWLFTTRSGGAVAVDVSAAANISPGRHLVILRDITDRKRAEAEALRRADQQAAVAELGRRALSGVGSAELMEQAVAELVRILDIELVEVLELDPDGRELVMRAGASWNPGIVGAARVAATSTQAGFTLAAQAPVIVEDLRTETRFDGPQLLFDHAVVSGLSVVIEGGERPYGVLGVHAPHSRNFSGDDVHFVQGIANVLGAALARERVERLEVQLQQSRRLDSVGQLAGGIAHDFNNLLGVIVSYSHFALDDLEPLSQPHRDVSEIAAAAKHGAELTKRLLLFSSHKMVESRAMNTNEVVEGAGTMLRRTIGAHVELSIECSPDVPAVRLGEGQLEQVLMNLALNGRDAMPAGGRLEIRTETVELHERSPVAEAGLAPGRYVRLSVADTGTGMSEEVVAQAMEPFFTTKETGSGTGLGLATVFGIAQAAGGYVQIASKPGRGTTVHVYMPACADHPEPRDAAVPSRMQGSGERVLLVEDDENVREATRRLLAGNGYEVIEAANGAEALELTAAARAFDLLLTDVVMPKVSGVELAKQLRADDPGLPVVYISGYLGGAMPSEIEFEPGSRLVEKPFSPATLLASVRAGLRSGPQTEAAGPPAA